MAGSISIWQLLIIALIVLLLFGGKKLRNLGGDLGGAIKGFRKAMSEGESEGAAAPDKAAQQDKLNHQGGRVIEGEVASRKESDKSQG